MTITCYFQSRIPTHNGNKRDYTRKIEKKINLNRKSFEKGKKLNKKKEINATIAEALKESESNILKKALHMEKTQMDIGSKAPVITGIRFVKNLHWVEDNEKKVKKKKGKCCSGHFHGRYERDDLVRVCFVLFDYYIK
ncbi:hypothetical protein RFI_31023 [Reticulomyxa filosa]|uniref:Uncharacterized protein n=1 Tax=Reticulomyxa filosa TaxID=46433 RepID=X6LXR1_RETFI|nr:hypothetical protein RFI_31023 [Reticulomyxa filosa]|eukprot:ETO06374.1 hypothetical protein RFI_31023 [Reticulomyxa filosa]